MISLSWYLWRGSESDNEPKAGGGWMLNMKERDECKTSIVANFHRGMQIQTIYLHSHAYVCQDNQNIEAAILNLPNHWNVHQIEKEPA